MKKFISKVPKITLYFWIIKILSTTVGETGADYLADDLSWGLMTTAYLTGGILTIATITQLKLSKYIASSYWFVVIVMSIVGTLITDILVDDYEISLVTLTIVFSLAMLGIFSIWYKKEKTLSIHSIDTLPRESYYWLVILIAFALGTAAGDLSSESANLGYSLSLGLFTGAIAIVTGLYYAKVIDSITAFWIAFILTRPIGASLGDLLIQLPEDGGLGVSAGLVNMVFFGIILLLISYLSISKQDMAIYEERG
jgi:uncharacterized membrane-anchored protein